MGRTATVVGAVVLAVLSIPIVWAIGYQDHPWRNSATAYVVSLVLMGVTLAVTAAGSRMRPPVPKMLGRLAIGM